MSEQLHIVALGSSFAAGSGIHPVVDSVAMRSGANYANLVAKRLNARLTDLSSGGCTLMNVLSEPQQFMLESRPPQLDGLPEDADIVTLTAGGNDIGYSAGMIGDAAEADVDKEPVLEAFLEMRSSQQTTFVSPSDATGRFIKVIDAIKIKAPNARVYLIDYLTIFGPDAEPSEEIPFSREKIDKHMHLADKLAKAYADTVRARPNVELIKASQISQTHGVGSKEPWVFSWSPSMLLVGRAPYHPNGLGHEKLAEILYQRITENT
ncbi:SGNH hydrolase [Polychaeton citri CBS 116435]|uniref:SGNH hydrolase n=1 Tax=Polychaeton citri CBS 116435 TaxID=1314669 RepID=A0A9P4Q6F4_9PEZI|nr:SGNH hydrolase [Polychaeton citri CBS 116435]